MEDRSPIGRRGFATTLLGGIAVTLSACGGGGGSSPTAATPPAAPPAPDPPADPPAETDGRRGVISANHGHEAVITAAEFASLETLLLDIRGQADHTHFVELTLSELDRIRQGIQVSKPSTDAFGHQHEVTFAAAAPLPDDY